MQFSAETKNRLAGPVEWHTWHGTTYGRISLPDISSAVQARGAATQLERIWKRWLATRGLPDHPDRVTAYVGRLPEDPVGQQRVIVGVDTAEAQRLTAVIGYLIASRPLDHPGANSGQAPSGNSVGPGQPGRGHHPDDYASTGDGPGGAPWSEDPVVPSPETAEAERPILPGRIGTAGGHDRTQPAVGLVTRLITSFSSGGLRRTRGRQRADEPSR
jgi:hypothetical protein